MVSVSAFAETISGKVVGVSDGDTITVLDANREQHKIRVSGIDAPEKAQPFGQRSKESMSTLVFGKDVDVQRAAAGCALTLSITETLRYNKKVKKFTERMRG